MDAAAFTTPILTSMWVGLDHYEGALSLLQHILSSLEEQDAQHLQELRNTSRNRYDLLKQVRENSGLESEDIRKHNRVTRYKWRRNRVFNNARRREAKLELRQYEKRVAKTPRTLSSVG